MKANRLVILFLVSLLALESCDLRSGIAKEEMEKFGPSSTPAISPRPAATPIDFGDIVEVDTTSDGDLLSANGDNQNTTTACTEFNRLLVNGDDSVITVKGVCRQIMINGDRNNITADAAMEFVFNGTENIIRYARFPNGKQPSVIENRPGNITEKIAADAVINSRPEVELKNEHHKRQRPLPKTEKRPRRRVEKLLHRSDDRLLS
jgi:hypothetical protein